MLQRWVLCGVAVLVTASIGAQVAPERSSRYVLRDAHVTWSVHRLPEVMAALRKGGLGELMHEPEVARVFERAKSIVSEARDTWLARFRLLASVDDSPQHEPHEQFVGAVVAIDWREVLDAQWSWSWNAQAILTGATVMAHHGSLRLVPDAATGLADRLAAFVDRAVAPHGKQRLQVAPRQRVGGRPAHVLLGDPAMWLARNDNTFDFGTGDPDALGDWQPVASPVPALRATQGLGAFMRFLESMEDLGEPIDRAALAHLDALGYGRLEAVDLQLAVLGATIEESASLHTPEDRGVLGSLTTSRVPLPPQPLPPGVIAQLRLSFDLDQLLPAIDTLLSLSGAPTTEALGIAADLRAALTGGLALAVAAPAPGRLEPRLYASLGIVDAAALDRLLARLAATLDSSLVPVGPSAETAWCMRLPGIAPALHPCVWRHGDTLHATAGLLSLRDLRRAVAAGAPPVLDIGPVEADPGILPNFELRYDLAGLYSALDAARPLLRAFVTGAAAEMLAESPPADVVAPHLGRGRIVAERRPDRIVFRVRSPQGGPLSQLLVPLWALPIAHAMTGPFANSGPYARRIAELRLRDLHAAAAAYQQRRGERCPSLGALLAAEFVRPEDLLIPGDNQAEPVVHEGRIIGRSSFRYFAAETLVDDHDVAWIVVNPFADDRICMIRTGEISWSSEGRTMFRLDPSRLAELLR